MTVAEQNQRSVSEV